MLPLLAAILLLDPTMPAPKAHVVDKAHSEINFVADARFFGAHGYFNTWDAEVELDRADMTKSSVKITIDAKSINTRNDRRDNHLKSNDFFATDSFPTITFTSKKIVPNGAGMFIITGDLTMRGRTKEIQVPVREVFYDEPKAGATGPMAVARGRWNGEFRVNRKEYGIMYDSSLNPVGDVVNVQWEFALVEKK
jgi:polyisoprenoid-binding protein YceI